MTVVPRDDASRWRRQLRRLDPAWVPAVLVALATGAFTAARWDRTGRDFSVFVCAGDMYNDVASLPAGLTPRPNSSGYDGQFYYRLALDPFTTRRTDFGIPLEYPAYRQARILYPLLAWCASLGRAEWVPAALVGVNLLALVLLGALGGLFAREVGAHALWGACIALYPGFLFSLSRDMAEIVEAVPLVAGLLCLRRGRQVLAGLCFSAAAFSRSTALLFPAAIFAHSVWTAVRTRRGAWREQLRPWMALPFAALLPWELYLRHAWGAFAGAQGLGLLTIPFSAAAGFVATSLGAPVQKMALLEAAVAVGFAVWAARACLAGAGAPHERAAFGATAAFAALLGPAVWAEDWAWMRVFGEAYVAGAVVLLSSPPQLRAQAFAATLTLWALLAIQLQHR